MNMKAMSLDEIKYDAENGGVLRPQDAVALLAEIDRLKRVGHEFCDELHEADIERNRLKAELAGLRTGFDAQNEVIAWLRKDAERWRFVRNAIPNQSPFAVYREGSRPFFGKWADEAIDAAMGKGGEA